MSGKTIADTNIELLTADEDDNAVPGMLVPTDRGRVVIYEPADGSRRGYDRLAYRHKFFRYDKCRQPMRETLVEFFVPDYMLDAGFPGRHALRLVEARMGWDSPGDSARTFA